MNTDTIFTPVQTRRNRKAIAAAISEHGDTLTAASIETLADSMAAKYVWQVRRDAFRDEIIVAFSLYLANDDGIRIGKPKAKAATKAAAKAQDITVPHVMASRAPMATPDLHDADINPDLATTVTYTAAPEGMAAVIVSQHVDISDDVEVLIVDDDGEVVAEEVADTETATVQGMAVSVLQEQLKAALTNCKRVLPRKSTLPALAWVKLTAKHGELSVAATDMNTAIIERVRASVYQDGSVAVDGKALHEVIASLPAGEVSLSITDDGLKVQSGRTVMLLELRDIDDMPILPAWDHERDVVAIDVDDMARAIKHTTIAAATDKGREILTCVQIKADHLGKVSMAAADGFRMSLAPIHSIEAKGLKAIVPAESLKALAASIGKRTDGMVPFIVTDKHMMAHYAGNTWIARLVDGNFPDMHQIIPKEVKITANVDRKALLDAVKSAAKVAKGNNDCIYLTMNQDADETTPGSIEVTAKGADKEVATRAYVDATVTGDALYIAFNSHYLTDALSSFTSVQVTLGFNGANAAATIREEASDTVHVIMLMVIGG